MAKRRGPGRPETKDPSEIPMSLRVNKRFVTAAEAYAKREKIKKLSTAVKHAAEQTFQRDGLL